LPWRCHQPVWAEDNFGKSFVDVVELQVDLLAVRPFAARDALVLDHKHAVHDEIEEAMNGVGAIPVRAKFAYKLFRYIS